ncbi:MAG: choice-of-anchor Q domain-containing protein, partial [Chloroflexota bacterium]
MNKTIYRFLRILGIIMLTLSTFHNVQASGLSLPEPSAEMSAHTTYYVSKNGNSQDGLSLETAWNELDQVDWDAIQPGDTIVVREGIYNTALTVRKSGTAENPIIVHGTGATIDGGKKQARGVDIRGSYISIDGLEVINTLSHAVHSIGDYVTFSNLNVHDNLWENKNADGSCKGNVQWGSGVSLKMGSEYNIVKNSRVWNNCGEGINVNMSNHAIVRDNVTSNNFGANIYIDNSNDVLVERNLSYCSDSIYNRNGYPAANILIGEEYYSGWGSQLGDLTVINNLSHGCRGIQFWDSSTNSGLVGALIAHNTIQAIPEGPALYLSSEPNNQNIIVANNLLSGSWNTVNGATYLNNLRMSISVANPPNPDAYKLQAGSTAINAGAQVSVPLDFGGMTRDTAPDVGAFEYSSGAQPPTSTPEPSPVPTNTSIPPTTTTAPTVTVVMPTSVTVGDTASATVNLNGVPAEGYKSAEFTCTYDPNLVGVSNIVVSGLFGTDPVPAIIGPQNGSFIVAIAGSKSQMAATSGAAFTFDLTSLQTGQATIGCQTRVSRGDNVYTEIASVAAPLTILDIPPTPTPSPSPTPAEPVLAGQVLASKAVTVSLYNADNSVAAVANVNGDGIFSLTAPPGTYTVVATASGFLSAQGQAVLAEGETSIKLPISLLAGDVDGN